MSMLQEDIDTYLAVCRRQQLLYERIDPLPEPQRREEFIKARPQRWDLMAEKREAAENILMSVQGEFGPQLRQIGLDRLFDELAAGSGPPIIHEIVGALITSHATTEES